MDANKVIESVNRKTERVKALVSDIEGLRKAIDTLDVCDPIFGGRITGIYSPKAVIRRTVTKTWKLRGFRFVRTGEIDDVQLELPGVVVEALVEVLKSKLTEDVEKLKLLNETIDI